MNPSKYIAEFIAVLSLALAVSLSLSQAATFPLITPAAAALTVGLFVYTIGAISGAHINPAITVGLLVNKKIDPKEAIGYLVAQCAAGLLIYVILNKTGAGPNMENINLLETGLAEVIGTFFLGWGVAAVAWGKATQSASGMVVGGSLLLGIIIAGAMGSAGVLNPAIAMSLGMFDIAYLIAPLVGSILAMVTYGWITEK